MTTLKTKIGRRLRSKWAMACYLLLLPIAAQVIGGALWTLTYEVTYSLGLPYIPFWITLTIPLWLLGVTLILAATLGNDIPKLLRDSKTWLWLGLTSILAIIAHEGVRQVTAHVVVPDMSTALSWSVHITPLGDMVELAMLVLLLGKLGFASQWSRRAVLWLVACAALFVLNSEINILLFELSHADSGLLAKVAGSIRYANVVHNIFAALGSLSAFGLCLSLGGRSLWRWLAPAPIIPPEEEPLEMSPEAVRGERALRYLFITWLALIASSLLMDGGFSISSILLLSCNAVFLYYGRRWARLFWFFHTATMVLWVLLTMGYTYYIMTKLWSDLSLAHLTELVPQIMSFVVAGVQLVVAIRLLRPRNTVASYMIYRMISPPDLQQLVWERRAKITCGCVVVLNVAAVCIYIAILI